MVRNLFLVVFVLSSILLFSQEHQDEKFESHGSPIVQIFANYHTDFGNIVNPQITRAYFGYKYQIDEKYSLKIVYDVADPGDWVKLKHTGYLKNAYVHYKHNKIEWYAGMITTTQFKVQEKFWGYRYLDKSYQDKYHMNASADIGASIKYLLMENLSIDAIVQNGEGYKYVQMDQTVRGGLGITYDPIESLRLRIYYDNSTKPNVQLQSFSGFVGYKYKDKLSLAIEYNKQLNHLLEEGKDLDGTSFYTTYFINKKFQVFGRFDYLESNKTEGHPLPWNYNNNGYYMTAGVQIKLAKGISVSANYRGFQSENSHNEFGNMMFVNFEYKLKH